MDFLKYIRNIPDFPKAGIIFYDITPLLADATALAAAIDALTQPLKALGVTRIASPEARGFLFGPAVAAKLGVGFVPVRKPGKLPWKTLSITYALEYGEDTLSIHQDAFTPDDRVCIVDDLLATGGTAQASAQLIGKTGATVTGFSCLMELTELQGRKFLHPLPVHSLIQT